ELRDKLNNPDLKAYAWNGIIYSEVDVLTRGHGYAVNDKTPAGDKGLCQGPDDAAPLIVELRPGWNLIGNPYHRALPFTEVFGDNSSAIADTMFEYSGNKYKSITKDSNLAVFKAVWVFALKPVILSYNVSCTSVTLKQLTPDATTVNTGASLTFAAYCETSDGEIDISQQATWNISASSVLQSGDTPGAYQAVAAGKCDVSASFGDEQSDSIRITVVKPQATLVSIELYADKSEVQLGESSQLNAVGNYSDGTQLDLTTTASYSLSATTIGNVVSGVFKSLAVGTTEIIAKKGNIKSNAVSITVVKKAEPEKLILSVSSDTVEVGKTVDLKVVRYASDGSWLVVTAAAAFTLSDTSIGVVEGGVFKASSEGKVQLTASFENLTSNTIEISVKSIPVPSSELILAISKNILAPMETAALTVSLKGADGVIQDVTSGATFSLEGAEGADPGAVENAVYTAHDSGKVAITATVGDAQSNIVTVIVTEQPVFSLVLKTEAEKLLTGESTKLKVALISSDGVSSTTSDVTSQSSFTMEPSGIGEIANGGFLAQSLGQVTITATYQDYTSNAVKISVEEIQPEPETLIINSKCPYLHVGEFCPLTVLLGSST
ncbi:MAG TPA: Ig-like domain-containing protein, partial [bacterium]|nr:Ig-like domain-containing protein [bacterium]